VTRAPGAPSSIVLVSLMLALAACQRERNSAVETTPPTAHDPSRATEEDAASEQAMEASDRAHSSRLDGGTLRDPLTK